MNERVLRLRAPEGVEANLGQARPVGDGGARRVGKVLVVEAAAVRRPARAGVLGTFEDVHLGPFPTVDVQDVQHRLVGVVGLLAEGEALSVPRWHPGPERRLPTVPAVGVEEDSLRPAARVPNAEDGLFLVRVPLQVEEPGTALHGHVDGIHVEERFQPLDERGAAGERVEIGARVLVLRQPSTPAPRCSSRPRASGRGRPRVAQRGCRRRARLGWQAGWPPAPAAWGAGVGTDGGASAGLLEVTGWEGVEQARSPKEAKSHRRTMRMFLLGCAGKYKASHSSRPLESKPALLLGWQWPPRAVRSRRGGPWKFSPLT